MPLQSVKPSYVARRLSAQARNHKFDIIPAPINGLDSSQPLAEQDPKSALFMQNWFARRTGVETRPGYRRWTTNIGGAGSPDSVNTLMSYQPHRGPTSTQLAKLFAAAGDGSIYDVTSQTGEGVTPSAVLTIAGQNEPGWFSYTNFSTLNTNYLCAVSAGSTGKYYTYDHVGGWVDRTAAVTGVNAADFDFVMSWKNRLWFIEENSTRAWFLPVGAITGAASVFDFGPLLAHGGDLRAIASWTLDSGDGVDDKLVVVSSMGDVLIYGGTDPTSASTFAIIGKWYVGPTPKGRRFLGKYGGDLSLLCENGVEYMSQLVTARGLLDPEGQEADKIARRYNEVIGADIIGTRDFDGWAILHVPSEESVLLITPHNVALDSRQYCFSTIPRAWSVFEGMPAVCAEFFNGNMYIGTADGKVGQAFAADTDDELTDGTPGADVECDLQTAFVAPSDDRMLLKKPVLVMPMFQGSAAPSVKAAINTEWNGAAVLGSPAFIPTENALWDQALWNQAQWVGSGNSYFVWLGAAGLGVFMSLRLALSGAPRTVFTSWKVVYEPGGIM